MHVVTEARKHIEAGDFTSWKKSSVEQFKLRR